TGPARRRPAGLGAGDGPGAHPGPAAGRAGRAGPDRTGRLVKFRDLPPTTLSDHLRRDGLAFRTGPFTVRLRSPLPELAEALRLPSAVSPLADGAGPVDFPGRVEPSGGLRRWWRRQARFSFAGEEPFNPLPRRLALPLLEWGLNWCVASQCHRYLTVHAA